LEAVACVELLEDMRDVCLRSVLGQDELGGDLRIRSPVVGRTALVLGALALAANVAVYIGDRL
jgi:hypothetical protein